VEPHDLGGRTPPNPGVGTIVTLVVLDVLLMAFSIVTWQLHNDTLAATAGAGAIALTVEIGRRLLNSGQAGPARAPLPPHPPAAAPRPPGEQAGHQPPVEPGPGDGRTAS
jgi:hypothetical protein